MNRYDFLFSRCSYTCMPSFSASSTRSWCLFSQVRKAGKKRKIEDAVSTAAFFKCSFNEYCVFGPACIFSKKASLQPMTPECRNLCPPSIEMGAVYGRTRSFSKQHHGWFREYQLKIQFFKQIYCYKCIVFQCLKSLVLLIFTDCMLLRLHASVFINLICLFF